MTTLADAQESLAALRTLKGLTTRTPSPQDAEALSKWGGWGQLAPAFDAAPEGGWKVMADQLEDLFSSDPTGYISAQDHLDTSYFTPPTLVEAVYAILRKTGFTGGAVLEPGCGSGRFMGATPADMDISWTGVEVDPTSAAIAAVLHPGAEIINKPLQKVTFKSGQFDAAIGNVPFSSANVFDPEFYASSLHEYFIARALDAVRDGGYIILITSRFSIDGSALYRARDVADFIGAVRLPSGAFSAEGTEVVADILVLRRNDGEKRTGWDKVRSPLRSSTHRVTTPASGTAWANPVDVSPFWANHPECVAGEMRVTANRYNPLAVVTDDKATAIQQAVTAMLPWVTPMGAAPSITPLDEVPLADAYGRKEGSFHEIDGEVWQVVSGQLSPVARPSKELRALIALRDATMALLDLESDPDLPEDAITPTRDAARALYAHYTRTFGPLNRGDLKEGKVDPDTGLATLTWRRPTLAGFRRDPDYISVMAIEEYDQETQTSGPAPILLRRVNARPTPVTRVDTADEALAVSLGEGRGVDLHRIGGLLGLDSPEAATAALGDRIYADPEANGAWVLDRDYLSGNVRQKLRTALAAAAHDPKYDRNVAALHAVQPADLGPLEIKASLGAPWISPEDIHAFIQDVIGVGTPISHTAVVATWELEYKDARLSSEVSIAWGTPRLGPLHLIEHALNGKTPIVYDTVYDSNTGKDKKVRNNDDTLAAEEKTKALQERFATWVWEDKDRADRVCAEYNTRFNSHVSRRNDGSYLTFPGMAEGVELWPWQKDIVDRALSSERFLCGHAVGAGKTKSMVTAAVMLRKFGLVNKPLIAVPNHLLEQIGREAQQTFPTGRFLIASKEDLAGNSRRLFAARAASGSWDAIVITHQALTSLKVDPVIELDWLEDQKAELRWHLQQEDNTRSRGAKQIARTLRSFEARIEALRFNASDENQVTFEQLGVDYLTVDECHNFKRLPIATRAEGFSLGSSKRATDLLLKITSLHKRFPGKPIVGLYTGTPWSNTLAETYVWQTYLQPERLEESGVRMFDAWAANFVRYETRVEVTPDGSGFRMYRRPAVIQNYAELRGMLADVADLLPASAIDLPRPEATVSNVVVKPTPEQKAFIKSLADRADRLRTKGKTERPDGKGEDNMLVICGDGRKAALDPALVGIAGENPKIEAMAQKISEIYHASKTTQYGESSTPGAVQAVFGDLGTPRPGDTQTYGRLRARLVALGVPAERIRWIHDANTDKAKAALFSACRDGSVSVIMGSTEKMGTGTNIQARLKALHHMDAPWRPSDLEQRDGRAIRPGNLNSHVDILRYVVEGSFDGYSWEILSRKARFIAQIFRADTTLREVEDISDVVLDYAQVKALAAGNPKLLNIASLQGEVRRFRTIHSVHQQSVNAARNRAAEATKSAAKAREHMKVLSDALAAVAHAGPADARSLANLNMFTEALLANRSAIASHRGLSVRPSRDAYGYGPKTKTGTTVLLTITVGYRQIGELELTKRALRDAQHEALTEPLDRFIASIPQRVADTHQRAIRREAEAMEATAAMNSAVFPQAAEMAEAERKLAEAEAEIAAEAAAAEAGAQQDPETPSVNEVQPGVRVSVAA